MSIRPFSRRRAIGGAVGVALARVGAVLAADSATAEGEAAVAVAAPRRQGVKLGMGYTTWWQEKDDFKHWVTLKQPGEYHPCLGYYCAGDPKIIERQYDMMRECGVDFLIFDDTNTIFVDNGVIDRNIRAWFDFMDALPASARIPLCLLFGGELNQHSDVDSFHKAADYLYETYANRPSYMRRAGKPFMLWYIERDVIPDWKDDRWFIRRCYHFFRTADQAKHEGWGWGSAPYPPDNAECMTLFPGWSLGNNQPIERRNGDYFMECWMRVVKRQPEYAVVTDWNQWQEHCSVEDATDSVDHYGNSTPDWYRQIIRGYKAMTQGLLLPGWYYIQEGSPAVYLYDGEKLIHQGAYPHRRPVLQVPISWAGNIKMLGDV